MNCDCIDDSIFKSIAKYAPEIEFICFKTQHKVNKSKGIYFGQLHKLHSLGLQFSDD